MNKNDPKQQLKEHLDQIDIPDSLLPSAVKPKLETIPMRKRPYKRYAQQAACILVLLIGFSAFYHWQVISPQGNQDNLPPMNESAKEPTSSGADFGTSYDEVKTHFAALASSMESALPKQDILAIGGEGNQKQDQGLAGSNESLVNSDESSNTNSYSDTNSRLETIDEADAIKTDGKYIYLISDNQLRIMSANKSAVKDLSLIHPTSPESTISEFFLFNGSLVILESGFDKDFKSTTIIRMYDINEPKNPKLLSTQTQKGGYYSARINDSYLYTFSNYYVESQDYQTLNQFVPTVNDNLMKPEDIIMTENKNSNSYLVVTAMDLNKPGTLSSQKSILSSQQQIYVTDHNIYVADEIFPTKDSPITKTLLTKIPYKDGKIMDGTSNKLPGTLNDSFSMDEYNGYLRLLTTITTTDYYGNTPRAKDIAAIGSTQNSLYILDEDLTISGSIGNIAPGERIYSARFMGNIGYFVTFRETDPLFSVDLEDPTKPTIIGSLKIPGFSSYLHPYGDNLLLGIGQEDGELKLSMFDTKDPTKVTETDKVILKGNYHSTVLTSYKEGLFYTYQDKTYIGFNSQYLEEGKDFGEQKYMVYRYDDKNGFTKQLSASFGSLNDSMPQYTRGVAINSYLYVVGASKEIQTYNIETGKKLATFSLK